MFKVSNKNARMTLMLKQKVISVPEEYLGKFQTSMVERFLENI